MSLSDDDLDTDLYGDPPWISNIHDDDCPIPEYSSHTHLEIVQSWIKLCNEHHGPQCHAKKEDSEIWPLWLIDVVEGCIVQGNRAARYLTLSYVWGGVCTLQATTSNIQDLQQPRSLDQNEDVLPKTIRQAMEFTRLIGEQYIWIDQLCIIQDEVLTKELQIEHMAELYANSYLTLVAATGESAASGLGNPIDLMSTEIRRRKYEHPDRVYFHDWPLGECSWSSRGWTFQENVFARRAIFFLEHIVDLVKEEGLTWECENAWWSDLQGPMALKKSLRLEPHPGRLDGLRQNFWPDLYRYQQLASSYAQRKFTYALDVVSAFSGFVTILNRTFRGGLLHGLPALFFDVTLLWQPTPSATQRLVGSHVREAMRLPTWSWMSWQGEINLDIWTVGSAYLRNAPINSLVIKPLVKWHVLTVDGLRIAIESDYNKYRHLFKAADGELPNGWSRIAQDDFQGPRGQANLPKSHVYRHSSDTSMSFNFPIPLVAPSHVEVPAPKSNLITCRTDRAWFSMAIERASHQGPYASLLDSSGVWSGMLKIVDDDLINNESRLASVNKAGCEVIAISTGSVSQDHSIDYRIWFQEETHPERPKTGEVYEFYNVLWIEWVEGIAYRKALGRVHKAAWEAAERELIDVVLG